MNKDASPDLLRYPIGKFRKPDVISNFHLERWIEDIAALPARIITITADLKEEALELTYRPEGWNIRQLVHHCADSHINAYVRFKLALTEDVPEIKPYMEERWAVLPDSTEADIGLSLRLLEGLHARWTLLLKKLDRDDLQRTFYHPEQKRRISLAETIGIYAWHSNHHLEHIRLALQKGKK